jgi:hypothetical protein
LRDRSAEGEEHGRGRKRNEFERHLILLSEGFARGNVPGPDKKTRCLAELIRDYNFLREDSRAAKKITLL